MTPAAWSYADVIAASAVAFREARAEVEALTGELSALYTSSGRVNPLTATYRAFLAEYRPIVGAIVAAFPSGEDRWHTIGDVIAGRGRMDAGCKALLDEQRITPYLIRCYGLTEDDLGTLAQYDYGHACRHGVMLDAPGWDRPVDAFEVSPMVRELEQALDTACQDLLDACQWYPGRVPSDLGRIA